MQKRPILRNRTIDGERVYYGRDVSPNPYVKGSHTTQQAPGRGYVYYNLSDSTYNHNKNIGVKGKEAFTHEIGHLKDRKNYSRVPKTTADRDSEIRADLYMAKRTGITRDGYKRFASGVQKKAVSDLMKEPGYQVLPINKKVNVKNQILGSNAHTDARNYLYKNWDRFKRFGLKESYGMSYVQYLMWRYF